MAYDSTKTLIKPLRSYHESEVIPFFAFSGESVNKGTFVKVSTGWKNNDSSATLGGGIEMGGDAGFAYDGLVSERYSVLARCGTANTGDAGKVIGLLLKDVRETDENGNKLLFNPRKAAELQAVVSGENDPILSRGVILAYVTGASAGAKAYINNNGELDGDPAKTNSAVQVGIYLGASDTDNYALLKLDL